MAPYYVALYVVAGLVLGGLFTAGVYHRLGPKSQAAFPLSLAYCLLCLALWPLVVLVIACGAVGLTFRMPDAQDKKADG